MWSQAGLNIAIMEYKSWIGELEHAKQQAWNLNIDFLDEGVEERKTPLQPFVQEKLNQAELPCDERLGLDINQLPDVCLRYVCAKCHVVNQGGPEEMEFIQVDDYCFSFGSICLLNPKSQRQISVKPELFIIFNNCEVPQALKLVLDVDWKISSIV